MDCQKSPRELSPAQPISPPEHDSLLDDPMAELLWRPVPVTRALEDHLAQPLGPGHLLTWQAALYREAQSIAHALTTTHAAYRPRGWK